MEVTIIRWEYNKPIEYTVEVTDTWHCSYCRVPSTFAPCTFCKSYAVGQIVLR